MARLEDITVGANVIGIAGNMPVSVVAVKWHGTNAMTVTFKNAAGNVAEQILYREDEERLDVGDNNLPWSFDADANLLRLTSEAYRINLAHIFDPYLAVHTSAIEPLPHQISAVYQEMLPRLPLRYILADDPGAGKTIMTGLFLKELLVRGDLKRCMIVFARQLGGAVAGRTLSEVQPAVRDTHQRPNRIGGYRKRFLGSESLHRPFGQAVPQRRYTGETTCH